MLSSVNRYSFFPYCFADQDVDTMHRLAVYFLVLVTRSFLGILYVELKCDAIRDHTHQQETVGIGLGLLGDVNDAKLS